MTKPLVTIISITYNQERYVRQMLDSFLVQKTDFAYEVLIHDDASTDGTKEIIEEYAAQHPEIIKPIFETKNQYSTEGLKFLDRMYAQAKGKYIAICEGDDYWTDPLKLQKQVDFLKANPDYTICFHLIRIFFENNEGKEAVWPNFVDGRSISLDELLKENFIPSNSVMYRKQKDYVVPPDVMPRDWYSHLYHAQFGKIGFINEVMAAYRRHSEGIWWDSHQDPDALLKRYGRSMLALYREILKMYGDDPSKKEIIHDSISGVIGKMVEADSRKDLGLVKQVMGDDPEAVERLVFSQDAQIKKQIKKEQELLSKHAQDVDRLHAEINQLRSQLFRTRDELHGLKNSRVVGRIIKLRNKVGGVVTRAGGMKRLPIYIVAKLLQRARVTVAPFVPEPGRKMVKRAYRGVKYIFTIKLNPKPVTLLPVDNEQWDESLPLVSVVIPYYNRGDTIDDTIASLQAQTFTDFEVIIVNDGSPDEASVEKLKELNLDGLNAVIEDQKNQGVAAARNNGIKKAVGKYVVCLDSDDILGPTYIEKAVCVLETQPDVALVTTHMNVFGVVNEIHKNAEYDPLGLHSNNMVITAAMFRRNAWQDTEGYKSDIGYEDWEYWLNLAEHGHWGKLIPEDLFVYRTSLQSRYVDDKDVHWNTMKSIRALHPLYKTTIKKLLIKNREEKRVTKPATAFVNVARPDQFAKSKIKKLNVMVTMPWMTFGGAETLVFNYCREIKDLFNITFVTGLKSENEWEYKFKSLSQRIYHLPNLFEDHNLYIEFVSNYITTRNIDVLHLVHNGFMFEMLPELKKRHPGLKVILTLFNDRVPEYVAGATKYAEYIDEYTTDNAKVAKSIGGKVNDGREVKVIPNGIDAYDEFSLAHFDREKERKDLKIDDGDIAAFFVGRLSEEKNPNVFVDAAVEATKSHKNDNLKFFVIGDGPMKHDIEKQIHDSGAKNIIYLGYQSEIAKYLSAADVFILPSSIEGFPLSILEAMAMNVAVIASDVGAVAEVVEQGVNGYVVKPGSAEEIAKRLVGLASDEKTLLGFKTSARKSVEKKYSNRILGANYKKLYEGGSK